jgi:hypothetical protein
MAMSQNCSPDLPDIYCTCGRSLGLLEPAVATAKATAAFAELDLRRIKKLTKIRTHFKINY